ncbi:MAG: hypothetical protein E7609_01285 [Ruminococcaceae bacterium]|nr:hypothetical protein [Oscillospiraceae bacterium]
MLSTDCFTVTIEEGVIRFEGNGHTRTVMFSGAQGKNYENEGFCLSTVLRDEERLYGLGDDNRDGIMKRGRVATLWQTDYIGYGPIPFLMSSEGWGILVNCTYLHTYDMGATTKDLLTVNAEKGVIDFYIFFARDMKGVLGLYTDVSGKPVMLPKAAYGFTFVCNEEVGAKTMLEDCASFRRFGIPCDIVGLEPGWMETHYDMTVDKKWDAGRFYLPYWEPSNYTGPFSFFYNLRKMGYKLKYEDLSMAPKAEFDSYTEEQMRIGHGGVDFWMLRNFICYLKGEYEPFFNVYRATALSAAAILAWRSVLNGGLAYDIPNFTKEENRRQYENDFLSPFASEESGNLISRKAK